MMERQLQGPGGVKTFSSAAGVPLSLIPTVFEREVVVVVVGRKGRVVVVLSTSSW